MYARLTFALLQQAAAQRKTLEEDKKRHDTLMGSISVAASCKGFLKQVRIFILLSLYTRSDWLLCRQDFLVLTGHYKSFSRLDGSFEL